LGQRLRDDERNSVTDKTYLLAGEDWLECAVALGRTEVFRHQMRGEAAELLRHRIGAGEHAKHARRDLGFGNVDPLDARMGVRG